MARPADDYPPTLQGERAALAVAAANVYLNNAVPDPVVMRGLIMVAPGAGGAAKIPRSILASRK